MGHKRKGGKSNSRPHNPNKSSHQLNRELRRIAHERERQAAIHATNGGRRYFHANHHL